MSDLLDGSQVPWDFISGNTEPATRQLPPPVRREPLPAAQTARRRLIAAGRWARP